MTDLGTLILDQFGGPDTDGDGILDAGEYALGTRPDSRDSDGDGLSDDAELTQGLNPNDGRSFPTGVIASLPLRGEAKEVVVEENLAYVATGSYGLAIVDVSRFDNPIILGQLDLPGDATDVAVDTTLKLAVVACSNSLQIVDVSDPMMPHAVRTNVMRCSRLEALLGLAFVATSNSLVSVDLRTGQTLQPLNFGGGTLTDVTSEGTFLYTMDSARLLRVVELANLAMVARGSLTLAEGGSRLFVGGGIAYVVAVGAANNGGGFSTVNVSNPTNLVLISNSDRNDARPRSQIAANGSGLAVQVGTLFPAVGNPALRQPRMDVMDVSDPANTDRAVVSYPLPPGPESVSIASGVGFVGCGANGLQVVNYRAFDRSNQPPTITLNASFSLNPPAVEEGKSSRLSALTADDSQVRDVEFYVDGAQVARDVSFPFEHRFITPVITTNKTNFTIRAKATDTGGNIAWSETVVVNLLDDMTPPRVIGALPAIQSVSTGRVDAIAAFFNEPVDARTLDTASVRIFNAGADGRLGTADDILVTNAIVSYRDSLNAVTLTFPAPLPFGLYQGVVSTDIADLSGNHPTNELRWTFALLNTGPDADDDGDELTNADELRYGTSPFVTDSDGDGWSDRIEIDDGSDPTNPASRPRTTVVSRPTLTVDLPDFDAAGISGVRTVIGRPPVSVSLTNTAAR